MLSFFPFGSSSLPVLLLALAAALPSVAAVPAPQYGYGGGDLNTTSPTSTAGLPAPAINPVVFPSDHPRTEWMNCQASSCSVNYRGVYSYVEMHLVACTETTAQLVNSQMGEASDYATKWTATATNDGGVDVHFNLPLQTDPTEVNDALRQSGYSDWDVCQMVR